MKKILVLLSFLICLNACSNKQNTNENQLATTPIDSLKTPAPTGINNSQKLLKNIMGTGDGLLRSISFGMPISQVVKYETAEKFEEDEQHIGYSFDTENLETVDILYMNDEGGRINEIEVDVYLNTEASSDSLQTLVNELFTVRYGRAIKSDSLQTIWQIKPKGGEVSLKKIDTKLDKGLEIKFIKNSKTI